MATMQKPKIEAQVNETEVQNYIKTVDKPKTVETQVGPSLSQEQEIPTTEMPTTIVPRPRTGLRG
jgi:hypothetical protein